MVTKADLQAFGVATVDIADGGHNVHVDQPELFARSVVEFVADRTRLIRPSVRRDRTSGDDVSHVAR